MMRRAIALLSEARMQTAIQLLQHLENKLGARGGGKPVMVQGSVKAAKSEIEEVLKEVL